MSEPFSPPRAGRTAAQKAMLGVNIVVIVACLLGAGVLLFGKSIRDDSPTVALEAAPSSRPSAPSSAAPGTAGSDPSDTAPPETFPPAEPEARNILVTGSDNNACVDPGSPWAGAADPNRPGGDRPDTIMVMRINPATNQAAVLSFPRDLYVDIPGRGRSRINSAFRPDEPQLLADTLFWNFGVPIDEYVQVDFCAFKRIVDAVGGVSVPFDTPIKDPNVALLIPEAGCHTFNGDEALAYVRSRKMSYQDANGNWKREGLSDQARISRQQDFLRRTVQAALDKGVLNPSVAQGLIDTVTKDIVVSDGLSLSRQLEFVGVLRNLQSSQIASFQVEGKGANISGASVLIPQTDSDNMKAVLAVFRGEAALGAVPTTVAGDTTTAPSTSAATTTVPDSDTTLAPGATSTLPVVAPEENVLGQIVPNRDVQC